MKRVFCVFGVALLLTGCAPRASQIDFDAKGKEFNEFEYKVENDWYWVKMDYDLVIPLEKSKIKSIEIDARSVW